MKSNYNQLGQYIEMVSRTNSDLKYGIEDVRGCSNTKQMMQTRANLIGRTYEKFIVLRPQEFVFNRRTTRNGEKIGMAYNNTDREYIFTNDYVAFRVKQEYLDKLLPDYLYMFFCRDEFDRYARYKSTGSATEFFNWEDMCAVPFEIPPMDFQQLVVNAYKVLNERIETKQKINDNLDDTAQTLYQKYFESNSDKSSWKQGTVGDVLQLQRGHDLPRTEMTGGKYPVAGSTGTIGYHDEFTAEAPVIVMGRSGNIGNPRLYLCNCWTHNTSLYVKQIYEAEPLWVFYLLKNLNYDGFVGGSAVPTLNRNDVHAYGIAIPPLELQKSFSQKVMSLIYCKEENLSEIEKLQELQKIILTTMSSR